ncbi:MAG: VWA domain-containing protein [Bryobacteraceae bacterium]|nr:VWA domain-containing protein [Bryobacteraceae bacterium]
MHQRSKTAALLAGALLLGAPWQAASQDDQSTFRSDTRLVVLHASVLDNKGNLITTLRRDDFKVFENGVEQQVKVFRREDVPVSMAMVIDNSGSMRDKRRKVEAAALGLVKASNRDDEVLIVNFNDEAYEDVPFTNDIKKMEEGLTKIDSRGGTAMRDALELVIDHVKAKAKKDKKVIFVVTDGNDNTSAISLEKLVQKAHNSEVGIYAIGLLSEEDGREAKKAKRALKAITEATGGVAYFPEVLDEVGPLALNVANDIRNQYIIAYSPSNQTLDGSFRQVKVTAGGKKYSVRTRSGYYASAEQKAARQTISQTTQKPE